jgi:hypothetical protein
VIVHIPDISIDGGEVCVSARVEMRQPRPGLPERIWFRFPEFYRDVLSDRGEGLAASLLLVAMFFGEPLEVRPAVSPRFAYGLREYALLMAAGFPRLFQPVDIRYDQVAPLRKARPGKGVGSPFSGGVDSFYTLWAHLPQNQPLPDARITHGLFMHGFNTSLQDHALFQQLAGSFGRMFDGLGLELVAGRSNARLFSQFRFSWLIGHAGALYGAALLLEPLFQRFYIPSTYDHLYVRAEGTSPLVDPLLSTEQMEFIPHGTSQLRIDKIGVIAGWPVTYDHLYVCARPQHGDYHNCGRCKKCIRTMATLHLSGDLEKYTTFTGRFGYSSMLHWAIAEDITPDMELQLLRKAISLWRLDIAFLTAIVLAIAGGRRLLRRWLVSRLPRELVYRLKRRTYTEMQDPTDCPSDGR